MVVASWFYYAGEPDNIILIKALVSLIWIVWAVGLCRETPDLSLFLTKPFLDVLTFWLIESLMLSAWLTIVLWQADQPVEESLWTFGVQFAVFFIMMSLFSYLRRK
ncbi:hypothetical protein [Phyllobacterium sp. K27]